MPLVTECQCDATTGDANKSANTYSKLEDVYTPDQGLINHIIQKYQKTWNEKAIVRHHLYMKTGSGYDRTFPDCVMTFVLGWGKTDIQQQFRKSEIEYLTEAH